MFRARCAIHVQDVAMNLRWPTFSLTRATRARDADSTAQRATYVYASVKWVVYVRDDPRRDRINV